MRILLPDALERPDIQSVAGAVVVAEQFKPGLVVGSKRGHREDTGAIFREDLNAAFVDKDV